MILIRSQTPAGNAGHFTTLEIESSGDLATLESDPSTLYAYSAGSVAIGVAGDVIGNTYTKLSDGTWVQLPNDSHASQYVSGYIGGGVWLLQ